MKIDDALTMERRARLAAERLAESRRNELSRSNRKLSEQARTLAEEVIEKREESQRARVDLLETRSQLETAERRLWTSLEAMHDGFAVFDTRGRMVAANRSWLKVFDGLAEVAAGITWRACLDLAVSEGIVDLQGTAPDSWVEAMAARWTDARLELVNLRLWSGAYVQLSGSRTISGDMICHAQNITKGMRREQRLRQAREKAEAASRTKSAFLATMSHELRTPMNGVLGMTQLLEETELSDEQLELIATIRSSSESLLRIINDVLDFSKAEAGRLKLTDEPFDLEDVILEVFHLLSPLVADRPIALLFDVDMSLPTKVRGDAGRMRQVLTNLVGNAIKFTHEGHVLVRLIGLEEDQSTRFVLTVEDTGIGIPEDQLDDVFGEFNQVESSTSRRYEGTGLGLSITKRLVGLMGGEIWVHSAPGEGSCFGIDVNFGRSDEPPGELDAQPGLGRSVALAVSSPAVFDILARQLQHFGCAAVDLGAVPDAAHADAVIADTNDEATRERHAALPFFQLMPGPRTKDADSDGTLTLPYPISRARLGEFVAGLADMTRTTAAERPRRKLRILAADDNKTNRMVFELMVRSLNADVRMVEDGQQAVDAWSSFKPDIVFMDISMPVVDGRDATHAIRALEQAGSSRARIYALTAHAVDSSGSDLITDDFDGWLPKPLKKDALMRRISEALPESCYPVEASAL